jgi:hypothetical protein
VKNIDYKGLGEESTRQHNVAVARREKRNVIFDEINKKDRALSAKDAARL